MGMKKIVKAIEKLEAKAFDDGYDNGYAEGYADAQDLFNDGVRAERDRVIALFKMLSDNEMESGTGSKAKMWKIAADTVKIADELEVYDEEGNYLE
jgi:flagellar biosynthesis/type III secretory pathway protein FliH